MLHKAKDRPQLSHIQAANSRLLSSKFTVHSQPFTTEQAMMTLTDDDVVDKATALLHSAIDDAKAEKRSNQ